MTVILQFSNIIFFEISVFVLSSLIIGQKDVVLLVAQNRNNLLDDNLH